MVDGKNFRFADEVRYILRRAAEHDGRVVTIGQLVLFSTETGDAWLLDPSDQLAARLARDGDPEPFHIEENERRTRCRSPPGTNARFWLKLAGHESAASSDSPPGVPAKPGNLSN